VPGGEAPIAFGFGLVHGLGFAEVLRELGLSGSELVVGLLGFNLGIELAQLVVVGLLMPSLWLLSRTRVYAPMREFLAAFAFVASLLWMSNRADLTDANPVEPVLDALVSNPLVVAAGLAVVALGTHGVERRRRDAAAG
jgi:hypothetical protein